MNTNSQFTVGVHTLTLLALNKDQPVTSELIAASVNTNPVVIRRVLGVLRAAGLVTSQAGNGGGWRLTREPAAISLRDVYDAIEDQPVFALHSRQPNPDCQVGRNIQRSLVQTYDQAKDALRDSLAETSIAAILDDVLAATP